MKKLNEMDRKEFIDSVGWIFEHSPWIAEKAWECIPFQSKDDLFEAMAKIVRNAEQSQQLSLLRAHPDLGSRLAMSEVSQQEQAGAGINQLSKEEYAEFSSLNEQYVKKFQFPFIMAVKGQTKDTILFAMKRRIQYTYEQEFVTALNEVYKIARFRLNDMKELRL